MMLKNILIIGLLLVSCSNQNHRQIPIHERNDIPSKQPDEISFDFNPKIHHKAADIPLPDHYQRIDTLERSFAAYLRSLPLKEDNIVYLFDGTKKYNQHAHWAVINMDVGTKDLQQCADAVMRLKAEFHYKQKEYDKIHFNFTSGHCASFSKYAEGYRARINGNHVSWQQTAAKNYSYESFRQYLNLVFSYAGSFSLSKELIEEDMNNIKPGDVFIQGGFPGHAVIVLDVARHTETGAKIFLLAQSFMPAQEIHILKNPNNQIQSPWYSTKTKENQLITPEWAFNFDDLMRFPD